jgi:hypothetical protein
MAKVNAQQWLDKWGRRLSAAGPDITAGIQRTTKDPGALAAAQKALWTAKLADPNVQNAWATNVSKVGAANWKAAMTNKGIPRLAQGITAAQANKGARITSLLSAVDAAVADANALPRGTIDQNIARANAFARSMAARAPKRTGG